jgi:hypothetical protein
MPKRRKTRGEKILSDNRNYNAETVSVATFSLPTSYKIQTRQTIAAQSFLQQKDLQKTILVSTIIIVFQIFLFYLLKHHIVLMPIASLQY